MSAHVSIFDIKRFAEARLADDEVLAFEQHLSACSSCADRLQSAATRELHARGFGKLLVAQPPRLPAVWLAVAASLLLIVSVGQQSAEPPIASLAETHPLLVIQTDAGTWGEPLAFGDGGGSDLPQ